MVYKEQDHNHTDKERNSKAVKLERQASTPLGKNQQVIEIKRINRQIAYTINRIKKRQI